MCVCVEVKPVKCGVDLVSFSAEAISCLDQAVNLLLEINRFNMAARYCKVKYTAFFVFLRYRGLLSVCTV